MLVTTLQERGEQALKCVLTVLAVREYNNKEWEEDVHGTCLSPTFHWQLPLKPSPDNQSDLCLYFQPILLLLSLGSNHTSRLRMGWSVQLKGLGNTTPFLAPNYKLEDLLQLILAPMTVLYHASTFCTNSMLLQHNLKMDASLVYAESLPQAPPGTAIPHRAELHALSLSMIFGFQVPKYSVCSFTILWWGCFLPVLLTPR